MSSPIVTAICPPELETEMRRFKMYYPYRNVWGYTDSEGKPFSTANVTKRQMNDAIRSGLTVFAVT